MARSNLARPVVAEAHALQLVAHRRDVVARPVGGMHLGVDCRILRRQSEGVPTHRVQNIEALGTAIAGDQIAHRVVPHMPDMQLAGRVWEHFKNIVFWAPGIGRDLEEPLLAPDALPFCFAFAEIVSRHGWGSGHGRAGLQAGHPCLRRRCFQLGSGVQARFSCRARLRIAFSRSVSTCLAIVVSAHCPSPERCWRSTVTVSESECNARDRMKTLIR